MADRKIQVRVISIVGAILLLGVLLYSSRQQTQNKYEVCVTFKGAMHCATASGATSADAIRSAQDIDCECSRMAVTRIWFASIARPRASGR